MNLTIGSVLRFLADRTAGLLWLLGRFIVPRSLSAAAPEPYLTVLTPGR